MKYRLISDKGLILESDSWDDITAAWDSAVADGMFYQLMVFDRDKTPQDEPVQTLTYHHNKPREEA